MIQFNRNWHPPITQFLGNQPSLRQGKEPSAICIFPLQNGWRSGAEGASLRFCGDVSLGSITPSKDGDRWEKFREIEIYLRIFQSQRSKQKQRPRKASPDAKCEKEVQQKSEGQVYIGSHSWVLTGAKHLLLQSCQRQLTSSVRTKEALHTEADIVHRSSMEDWLD